MADDEVIKFDDAKRPHVFRRKESKLKALKQAFKSARETATGVTRRRKKRKKGKKK